MSSTDGVKLGLGVMTKADKDILKLVILFIVIVYTCFWIEGAINPRLPEIKSMVVVDKSDTGYIVCNPKEMTCYTMTSSEEIIIGDNIYGVEDME
jgi:hypothetical protein